MGRAEKIQYTVYSKDSVLDLSPGYAIAKSEKFRGQQVEIEIQIPAGKVIRFDRSVTEKLNPANFRVKRKYRRNGNFDIQFEDPYYFRFRTDVDYIMGIDGNLKDASGSQIIYDDYRYRENDSIELERSIQRKRDELQQLEEKKNKQKEKPVSFKPESLNAKDNVLAYGPPSLVVSPLSLMN